MKTFLTLSIAMAGVMTTAVAQNMIDAVRFGQTDIVGTARYRAMAGAFGALGGDPSCMGDNPAGLAVYRRTNTFSITPHLAFTSAESRGSGSPITERADNLSISNLSMVLSFPSEGIVTNFNLGVGFQRRAEMRRRYSSYMEDPVTSFGFFLSNQANDTYETPLAKLAKQNEIIKRGEDGWWHDPLEDFWPWQNMSVTERTRWDEYQLSGAVNIDDFFYAGLTLGVTDYNSTMESSFSEDYELDDRKTAYIDYDNLLESRGTGFVAKLGLLWKPVEGWNIGAAIHTPTWVNFKDIYWGEMDADTNPGAWGHDTGDNIYEYRYRSPWEVQVSTAFILGTRGLLSMEYDARDFSSMEFSASDYDSDQQFRAVNDAMKHYGQWQHTMKVGMEVRLTKQVSLRLGYAHVTSPYKDIALKPDVMTRDLYLALVESPDELHKDAIAKWTRDCYTLYDSNTKPNYNTVGRQNYITGGLGYRGKHWTMDLSCMSHSRRDYTYNYPDDYGMGDRITLSTHTLDWDLSFAYRF